MPASDSSPSTAEATPPTTASTLPSDWSRILISSVRPSIEGGRWPIKRAKGETVAVTAGVIVDSHEALSVELLYRHDAADNEHLVPMESQGNDEYRGTFTVHELGTYTYRVRAWMDRFATWQDAFRRRVEGDVPQDELNSELQEGISLLEEAAQEATGRDFEQLQAYVEAFEKHHYEAALGEDVATLVHRNAPHDQEVTSDRYEVLVDPPYARSGAWYEFFPRSAPSEQEHATLDDAAELLPRIAEMGFDVVYLPPVHPIGETNRKGKDNAPVAEEGDPGSPWAIGGFLEDGTKGGHKSVHPRLGGIEAFDRFVERANAVGIEVAIDIAFQASPDHPYVEEHPEWFSHRPDGSIRYAENPPKK